MKVEGFLPAIGRFVLMMLLSELVIMAVTGLICWVGGWHTLANYGSGLITAGVIVMFVGVAGLGGATRIAGNPTYRYIQSVSSADLHTRTRQIMLDLNESRGFTIVAGIVGIISIALGTWLSIAFA